LKLERIRELGNAAPTMLGPSRAATSICTLTSVRPELHWLLCDYHHGPYNPSKSWPAGPPPPRLQLHTSVRHPVSTGRVGCSLEDKIGTLGASRLWCPISRQAGSGAAACKREDQSFIARIPRYLGTFGSKLAAGEPSHPPPAHLHLHVVSRDVTATATTHGGLGSLSFDAGSSKDAPILLCKEGRPKE
jgi:hypothetical protein